jgi:hypothetical protein
MVLKAILAAVFLNATDVRQTVSRGIETLGSL